MKSPTGVALIQWVYTQQKQKRMISATCEKHQLSPIHLKLTLEKIDIEQVH